MRVGYLSMLSIFALLFCAAQVHAAPTDDQYKRVRRGRDLVLRNCPLVGNATSMRVQNRGRKLAMPDKFSREAFALGAKFKFFACATNDLDQLTVFAKEEVDSEPVEFNPTIEDFPKREDTFGCKKIASWPRSHIYKKIGSPHFTDLRRNTIGVILKIGAGGPKPGCVVGRDSEGKVVVRLGLYAVGGGWGARYYAGIGCGAGTPLDGADVGRKAKKNTGDTDVAFDFGSICYGPVDPNRCINSVGC